MPWGWAYYLSGCGASIYLLVMVFVLWNWLSHERGWWQVRDYITVVPPYHWAKKHDKLELQSIVNASPASVYIDGRVVETGEPFNDYVDRIKYGQLVVVKFDGQHFGFKRRTDNTLEVQ